MKKKLPAGPVPNGAPRPGRRRRPLPPVIPFALYSRGQCWVLAQLRRRQTRPLTDIARKARVGSKALWKLEHHRHLNSAALPYVYAHALGYKPEHVLRLTSRWLRKYLRRARRRLGRDDSWLPLMPWEQC